MGAEVSTVIAAMVFYAIDCVYRAWLSTGSVIMASFTMFHVYRARLARAWRARVSTDIAAMVIYELVRFRWGRLDEMWGLGSLWVLSPW